MYESLGRKVNLMKRINEKIDRQIIRKGKRTKSTRS